MSDGPLSRDDDADFSSTAQTLHPAFPFASFQPADHRHGNKHAGKKHEATELPPWYSWTEIDLAERCIRFIETYCVAYKGRSHGKNIALAQWQQDWLRRVFTLGINASILTLAKKNGKSTFAAGIALWALHDPAAYEAFGGEPLIPVIGPTIKQTEMTVYGAVEGFIRGNEYLRAYTDTMSSSGNRRAINWYRGGQILCMAGDNKDKLQGVDPSLVIVDEVGFMPMDVWSTLTLSMGARDRGLMLGMGTRSPGETPNILDWHLEQIATLGAIEGFDLVDHTMPVGYELDSLEGLKLANPGIEAGILTYEALTSKRDQVPESEFRVYHCNQKVAEMGAWLGADGPTWWNNGIVEYEIRKDLTLFLGVDKSNLGDDSAIAKLQQMPGTDDWYCEVEIFHPGPDGIDHAAINARIQELCDTHQVQSVGYDNRYFAEGAQMLQMNGCPMTDVPQVLERMGPATAALRMLLMFGRFKHPDDKAFRSHVLNAHATTPDVNNQFRLDKGKSKRKDAMIDAAVATVIAVYVSGVAEPAFDYSVEVFA